MNTKLSSIKSLQYDKKEPFQWRDTPWIYGFLFLLIPLGYMVFGRLNASQAGKFALLGLTTLNALLYWLKASMPRHQSWTLTLNLTLIILCLYLCFLSTIRDIFGLPQEGVLVVQALFNTNPTEVTEFFRHYRTAIGQNLLISVTCFSAIFWLIKKCFNSAIILKKNTDRSIQQSAINRHNLKWAMVWTIICMVVHTNPTMQRFNPLVYFPYNFYQFKKNLAQAKIVTDTFHKLQHGLEDAQFSTDNTQAHTVVLVIGESDTLYNWSLYGYPRQTTPMMQLIKDKLLVFRNIAAADSATVGSITKMLTAASLENPEEWQTKPHVLHWAKKAGYHTTWISNQDGKGRGIISFLAEQANVSIFTNKGLSRGESTFDEAIITPFQTALDTPHPKKLIILHLIGNHPAYHFRYPKSYGIFEKMLNDSVSLDLIKRGRISALINRNQYDSSVYYHDMILHKTYTMLQKRPEFVTWLYTADHGQDVAHHNGFSGHNHRVKEMWHVPFILWSNRSDWLNRLRQSTITERTYQLDQFEHTLFGILGIRGSFYIPKHDLLHSNFYPAGNTHHPIPSF